MAVEQCELEYPHLTPQPTFSTTQRHQVELGRVRKPILFAPQQTESPLTYLYRSLKFCYKYCHVLHEFYFIPTTALHFLFIQRAPKFV